ncbi:hypothetical protein ACHAXN_000411 [Cyclotella atomus]
MHQRTSHKHHTQVDQSEQYDTTTKHRESKAHRRGERRTLLSITKTIKRSYILLAGSSLVLIWLAWQWHVNLFVQQTDRDDGTNHRDSKGGTSHRVKSYSKGGTNHRVNSDVKEVSNHLRQKQHTDPLTGSNQCDGTKYLYFAALNGFCNQLRSIWFAMRIAYSTNRTLIMPPVLPHRYAKASSTFVGHDMFILSLEPVGFMKGVNKSLDDVNKARAVSNPAGCPSWSEILDYDVLFETTGVKMVDLWNIAHTKSDACVNEFYRQPTPPVSLQLLTNRSTSWGEFVDLFTKQYANHSIASIGDVYTLNHYRSPIFTSHQELLGQYDWATEEKLSNAVLSMKLSSKVVGLVKAAMTYLPDVYASVHVRVGDRTGEEIQACDDEELVSEYTKALDKLKESNIAEGSTIYIASNDDRAKECFDEITKNKYKLMNLADVKEIDSRSSTPKINMDGISVDPTTKDMLLDLFLVAMGVEVAFAFVHFLETGYKYSTYQEMMKTMHNERFERMKQFRPL